MNEKVKKLMIYLMIFGILLISLSGCSNNNESDIVQEKIKTELEYLDVNLIGMLNKVNGISIQNYIVTAQEIKEKSQSNSKSKEESSSESGGESKSSESSGSSENSEQSDSEESGSQSEENKVQYKMEANGILVQDRTTDWNELKSDIEKLYSDWLTIELDLYKMNVNNQDILNFGTDLDIATKAIKDEDKMKSLEALAKLYSYIPKYTSGLQNSARLVSLYQTKSNILNAYSIVEGDNFSKIDEELKNAEQSFLPIINDMSKNTGNQANINKAYVLIKELQNYSTNRDKEIFYVKYKNISLSLFVL